MDGLLYAAFPSAGNKRQQSVRCSRQDDAAREALHCSLTGLQRTEGGGEAGKIRSNWCTVAMRNKRRLIIIPPGGAHDRLTSGGARLRDKEKINATCFRAFVMFSLTSGSASQ